MRRHPPDTKIEVRAARPGDAEAIARVHVRSFLATYPQYPATHRSAGRGRPGREKVWAEIIEEQGDRVALVACESERIVGFALVGGSPARADDQAPWGELSSIHVDPEWTGSGTGTRLLDEAVKWLANAGYETATLWVVEDNHRARRFYENQGWGADGTRRRERLAVGEEDGDSVVVVRYRRDITPDPSS